MSDRPAGASPGPAAGRLEGIDGLRGLAALLVLLYHARDLMWIGITATYVRYGEAFDWRAWAGYATAPLSFGYVGVPLFFVISGYCIHRPYARMLAQSAEARLDLWKYAQRRFWRIYPTYLGALLFVCFVDAYVLRRYPASDHLGDDSLRCLLVNVFSMQGLLGPSFGSDSSLWTLSIEIHLYAVYPFLFYTSRRWGPAKTLAGVFAVSLGFAIVQGLCGWQVQAFVTFWFLWAAGFYVAEWEAGRAALPLRPLALLAVVVLPLGVLLPWAEGKHHWGWGVSQWFLLALPAMVAVGWSLTPRGTRVWRHALLRPLVAVGLFSYSVYVVHEPALLWLRAWLRNNERSENVGVAFLFALLAVAVAYLLFLAVERYSLKRPQPARASQAA